MVPTLAIIANKSVKHDFLAARAQLILRIKFHIILMFLNVICKQVGNQSHLPEMFYPQMMSQGVMIPKNFPVTLPLSVTIRMSNLSLPSSIFANKFLMISKEVVGVT